MVDKLGKEIAIWMIENPDKVIDCETMEKICKSLYISEEDKKDITEVRLIIGISIAMTNAMGSEYASKYYDTIRENAKKTSYYVEIR